MLFYCDLRITYPWIEIVDNLLILNEQFVNIMSKRSPLIVAL